ncbi:MAG TPA: MFS transporter [Chitinophagaceae bacterium]|nr:MFS transporter [Chitinophagaceae bacterium]
MEKTKKVRTAWAMYDWANSAYNLVITSTIFPAYYIAITGGNSDSQINFFGWRVGNSALLEYSLSLAYLVIALLSPILSAIADYKGNKKAYMKFYCYLGGLACIGLFFFRPGKNEIGILFSMLAAIGYCGSLVFYNSYLPEIAPPAEQDKLSAKGFTYGYIGSVILQLICFVFVFSGFEDSTFAPRLSFLLVGVWWIAFAQISFRYLPAGSPLEGGRKDNVLTGGFRELGKVWNQVKQMPKLKTYLFAFFFYSMGVQTVMLAATIFGSKEIRKYVDGQWVAMEAQDLIPAILMIQIVAIFGAMLLARLSKAYGNMRVLSGVVLLWIGICIAAYYTYTNIQFYVLAVCVGLVMGGIQSLSRSTYSKLLPAGTHETTSFFSLYDIMEKMSIVLGMFSFALIEEIMHSMRYSILALILFFVLGMLFLLLALRKKEIVPFTGT